MKWMLIKEIIKPNTRLELGLWYLKVLVQLLNWILEDNAEL